MKEWFTQNWDKLLSAFVSVVLAGTVGYFSGIMAVNSDIADLRERVRATETEVTTLKKSVEGLLSTTDQNTKSLQAVTADIQFLKRQNDIAVQSNKLLDLLIEQQQSKTVNELQELIKSAKAKAVTDESRQPGN